MELLTTNVPQCLCFRVALLLEYHGVQRTIHHIQKKTARNLPTGGYAKSPDVVLVNVLRTVNGLCGAVGPSALKVVKVVQQPETEVTKLRQSMAVLLVREMPLRVKNATLRIALFIVNGTTGANGLLAISLAEVV